MLKCRPIILISAFVILTNCRKVKVLRVEAKYPAADKENWCDLCSKFLDIDFSPSIAEIVWPKLK